MWLVDSCCLYCSSLTLQVVLHLNVNFAVPQKKQYIIHFLLKAAMYI